MGLPAIFNRYRTEIDTALRASLASHPSPMYRMLRYHMGWEDEKGNPRQGSAGKALRPTLCLLACESVGGDFTRALPAAAALELIHNFSLIHDDIQDGDLERRHRPTVWALWGKPQAINAGTAMKVVANLTLLSLGEQNVPAQQVLRAQQLLDSSCLRLIEGQYLDIAYENRLDVRVDDYLTMISGKTGSLIAATTEMGALLGTKDEQVVSAFRGFGMNLGLAFQVRDDVLGIWGKEEKTGKPVGSDIRRRKKSLPIVYALERTEGAAREELLRIYGHQDGSEEELDRVLEILAGIRAEAWSQGRAEQLRDRALAEIEQVELCPWARSNLVEMANFLTTRDY